MNVFSPHYPDGFYRLDLARSDERLICKLLVKLAVVEPGENWGKAPCWPQVCC